MLVECVNATKSMLDMTQLLEPMNWAINLPGPSLSVMLCRLEYVLDITITRRQKSTYTFYLESIGLEGCHTLYTLIFSGQRGHC